MNEGSQNNVAIQRNINPSDISVPLGYNIEVFAQGLDLPVSMSFTDNGELIVAELGYTTGNPRILRLSEGRFDVIAENFNVPLTGINYYNGVIYVSHRGFISVVEPDGTRRNIITGLPSNGDYHNNRVEIGPDEKIYFGQGTTTNSGVVGLVTIGFIRTHSFVIIQAILLCSKGKTLKQKIY